jgi:hypothetical protein
MGVPLQQAMTPFDDLLIGTMSGYDWEAIEPWAVSLDRSGYRGRKVVLACNADPAVMAELRARAYEVVTYAIEADSGRAHYPTEGFQDADAAAERFYLIWRYLAARPADYRYVMSVDMRDALFQANPVDWLDAHLDGKAILASSEAIRFGDEEWCSQSLLENFGPEVHRELAPRVIRNSGVIAGRGEYFRDLCLNVHLLCRSAKTPYADQAALNILLSLEPYRSLARLAASEDGWACHCGVLCDPDIASKYRSQLLEPEPRFDGSIVLTHAGKRYSIVHQYDRVPAWRDALRRRYTSASR